MASGVLAVVGQLTCGQDSNALVHGDADAFVRAAVAVLTAPGQICVTTRVVPIATTDE